MSGLEPLAALGLACNIMQLISFCGETLTICKSAYAGKAPEEELENLATSLLSVSSQVQEQCRGWTRPTKQQLALQDIATKCAVSARALEDEIGFIGANHKKGNLIAVLKVAAKTNWRKRRLDRLEKSLGDYQRAMETHLLQRTCSQVEAMKLEQSVAFKKLGLDLQAFISHFAAGHTKLQALLSKESLCMKSHVTTETSRIEGSIHKHTHESVSVAESSIKEHITSTLGQTQKRSEKLRDADVAKETREKLLESFVFNGMNERRNMISEAHRNTFQWVFAEDISIVDSFDIKESNGATRHDDDNASDDASDDGSAASWETSSSGFDYDSWYPKVQNPKWNNFSDWLRSDSNLFWISGKPGSGKSTLVSYLINNPQTRTALDSWRTGTDILSHFFWRPGSVLQQNLKGFYCALLHQAYVQCPELLTRVLGNERLPHLVSLTDWAVDSLKPLLWHTLIAHPQPVCIFIDGLDEAYQDDQTDLLDIIFELSSLSNVKVCVSGRREQRFVLRLDRFQQLALQDLTEGDMREFVTSQMRILLRGQKVAPSVRETIQSQLVQKAEGVFLWVILAVKSLRRGFENGDTLDILLSRLRTLPRELSDLYQDMWSRMSEDQDVYARSAAKHFNLLVSHREMVHLAIKNNPMVQEAIQMLSHLSLLFVSLALDRSTVNWLVAQKGDISPGDCVELIRKAKNAEKIVRSHCAGLLEVVQLKHEPIERPCNRRKWRVVVHNEVRFVHRTAYDFLVNSEEGLRLRLQDEESHEERVLVMCKTMVAVIACLGWNTDNDDKYFSDVSFILEMLSEIQGKALRSDVYEFLDRFWGLYERQIALAKAAWTPHFLAFAFSFNYREYALQAIEKSPNPPRLASSVLLGLCSGALPRHRLGNKSPALAELSFQPLLCLGANPDARSEEHSIYYRNALNNGSFHGGTALAELLKNIFQFWNSSDAWRNAEDMNRLVWPLFTASSSLDERVTLFVQREANLAYLLGHILQAKMAYWLRNYQHQWPKFDILTGLSNARSSYNRTKPFARVQFIIFPSSGAKAEIKAHQIVSDEVSEGILARFNTAFWPIWARRSVIYRRSAASEFQEHMESIAGQLKECDTWAFQDALDRAAEQEHDRYSADCGGNQMHTDCIQ